MESRCFKAAVGEYFGMKNFRWNKKYLYSGVTAFLVIIACIAFYWTIQRWSGIKETFSSLLGILSPIIGGFVLAYLLAPFVKMYENRMFIPLGKKIFKNNGEKVNKFGRGMSIFFSILILIAIIAALFSLVLPQVYESIQSIVFNLSSNIRKAEAWANKWLDDFPEIEEMFTETVGNLGEKLTQWAKDTLLPQMNDIITSVSVGVFNVVKAITNAFIAIVVSVYVMYSREQFAARGKKVLYSIFSVEHVKSILAALRFTDKSFMGFFTGKLLDSLIIGIICYIGCLFMDIPDSVLISVIIGITNIIPFFGPFFGAVPSALIVLMHSPLKCLVFVIFIIILQQFDGNILGPKILGSTTGLSGFWVLFSIIVGGGMFGFVGMIVGVPAFAVIYMGLKTLVNNKLKKSGLPYETAQYTNMRYIDPDSLTPVAAEHDRPHRKNKNVKKESKDIQENTDEEDKPDGDSL